MTVYIVTEPMSIKDKDGNRLAEPRPLMNFKPASAFGTLEVLVPSGNSMLSTVPVVRKLRDKLENFNDDDYIVPVGDPTLIIAAGAIAARNNKGRVKVLSWDKETRAYIPIQIDVTGSAI